MNIKPAYVTFDQAKWLKSINFNLDTKSNFYQTEEAIYKNEELLVDQDTKSGSISMFEDIYAAPEQWQVVEWFRINHNIWINVHPVFNAPRYVSKFGFDILGLDEKSSSIKHYFPKIELMKQHKATHADQIGEGSFKSPQEAYSAAFDYIKEKQLI
jgi:hypothetical protein